MNQENVQWLTPSAKQALEGWVRCHRQTWEREGADPEEIRSDLESHLWRSRSEGAELVTRAEVEAAVVELGLPAMIWEPDSNAPAAGTEPKRGVFKRVLDHVRSPFYYGVFPLLVVIFELLTGSLGATFFDPISRASQGILLTAVALVGLAGYFVRPAVWTHKGMMAARGAGAVVAGYWGVLCVPVMVMGTIGYGFGVVMSFGIGLMALPIYLLCVVTAAAPLLLLAGFLRNRRESTSPASWWWGIFAGLVLLVLVEGPAYLTRYGVAQDDLTLVRRFGSEETLLGMCYEGRNSLGRKTDTSGFVVNGRFLGPLARSEIRGKGDFEKRQEMYYRVTGQTLESVSQQGPGRRGSRGVDWDRDLGSDGVSARLADLDLHSSRLDGHLDAASGLGYWEWTMEFQNDSFNAQEARMQILLPNGGVVSRLTLWINGEPQEAAFSSTAKVTAAYKAIAVRERRDPVLVRWIGADRIMAQCFPVPSHGKMKIRIGVTAPFDGSDRLFLPRLIEQNFGIPGDLETKVWVQGDLEMELKGLEGEGAAGRWRETHGTLPALELMSKHTHVQCSPGERPALIWTEDPFAEEAGKPLLRTSISVPADPEKAKIVLVIDGSEYFSEWAEAADDAIAELRKKGHEVSVVAAVREEVLEDVGRLADLEFEGGQESVPALEKGLSKATSMGGAKLIWLHGTQPYEFRSEEGFLQLLERGFHQVDFAVVDLAGGPNRLLEKVARRLPLAGSARPQNPSELGGELRRLLTPPATKDEWSISENDAVPPGAIKVWDQLARWHAWQGVREASFGSENHDELANLAARYQLVTPVSGAVVLETQEQYRRFGLEQIDASTAPAIPGVPEPSTVLLGLLSLTMIWKRRRNPFPA